MFTGKSRFLFLICILYIGHTEPGIVRIDTIRTVDDRKITFLGDNHGLNEGEQEKIDCVMGWLQDNEKTGDPIHVLIEQPSWFFDIFECDSEILFHLPKRIQQAIPKCTLTTHENLEIRHVANAAHDILTFLVPYQLNPYRDSIIDTTEKTLGTLTFQDVLNEFVRMKQFFSDYYLQQNNVVIAGIYNRSIVDADFYYKHILRIIKEDEISPEGSILKYTKKNSLNKTALLAKAVHKTFSPFFDLHAIRTLLTTSHKNIIVVAGFWHTHNIMSALHQFDVYPLYSAGKDICQDHKLVSIAQIQQGLSMQKQSLMRMYAPMIVKKTIAVAVCYLLYITIMQTIMQV